MFALDLSKMIPLSVKELLCKCSIVVDNAAGHTSYFRTSIQPGNEKRAIRELVNITKPTTIISSTKQVSRTTRKKGTTHLSPIVLTQKFGTVTRRLDVAPRMPIRTVDETR
jgi:hypothetical protein